MQEIFNKSLEELRGFPCDTAVKNMPATAEDARDMGSIPGLERSRGERNGNPLQSSCWKILWTKEPGGLQSVGS